VDRIYGGMLCKSHYFQIWKDSLNAFLVLGKEFGILPSDRKEFGKGDTKGFDLEDILGRFESGEGNKSEKKELSSHICSGTGIVPFQACIRPRGHYSTSSSRLDV